MEKISLKNENLEKFEIYDTEGNFTGNYLTFDLEDIELPLIYQDLLEKQEKNKTWYNEKMVILNKKQDTKTKNGFSTKQIESYKILKEFFEKEKEIYNMFLGENGVEKLLNGRKLGWTTLMEIDELIEKQILPKLNINMNNITNKIKNKYKLKEENTLE